MKRLIVVNGCMLVLLINPFTWAQGEGGTRTLIFENQSQIASNVCIYQSLPISSPTKAFTVAWFCQSFPRKLEGGTSQVVFQWTEDYSFVLFQTGNLASGITFTTSQVIPANQKSANEITLKKPSGGAYSFIEPQKYADSNRFVIHQDQTIKVNELLVGIGMAGSATALVQALPNVTTIFEIEEYPKYWIFFGNSYKGGQVLNINEILNKVEIQFQDNVTLKKVILQADNTWRIEQTQKAQ